MTRYTPEPPRTETQGSSATTAIAVGAGAFIGTTALVLAAPVVLPFLGLAAVVGYVSAPVGAGIGALLGYSFFGKK